MVARKQAAIDRRIAAVTAVFLIGLMAVAFKLVLIQGIQASRYQKLAREQRDESITIPSRRGTIFDREGEVLAISEGVATVYATPYLVKDKSGTARRLAEALGADPADIAAKLAQKNGFVYLARKIDKAVANRVRAMKLTGIGFLDESKRLYPFGSLAAQDLGIVDIDNKGQAGLELYYQALLGGKPGEIQLEKDAAGVPIPGSEKRRVPAVDGVDIELTLDKDIQGYLEKSLADGVDAFGAKAGTALVMDCNNGNILAMASSPTFDAARRADIKPDAMRNRAITDVYEPGSALKIVTASAALEEGVVGPSTVITVPSQLNLYGAIFKDAEPEPTRQMDFTQIISQSSNVGTILVGRQLGAQRLSDFLGRFGLGAPTGVDFPGEVQGLVPALAQWSGTSVATISIGQGISLTPLQLGCAAAAIANGGRKVSPHFLASRVTGSVIEDMGLGGVGDVVVSKETCQKMAGIMMQVLAQGGTGVKAGVRYYSVSGKTGTAEKPAPGGHGYSGNYMATFVGFAPSEKPRLVALVVFDEPSPIWGSETAAPVFSKIMGFSLQHLKIPPSHGTSAEEEGQPAQAEPAQQAPRD